MPFSMNTFLYNFLFNILYNFYSKLLLTLWYHDILYGFGLDRIWHSKYTSSASFMSSGFNDEPIFNVTTGISVINGNGFC